MRPVIKVVRAQVQRRIGEIDEVVLGEGGVSRTWLGRVDMDTVRTDVRGRMDGMCRICRYKVTRGVWVDVERAQTCIYFDIASIAWICICR